MIGKGDGAEIFAQHRLRGGGGKQSGAAMDADRRLFQRCGGDQRAPDAKAQIGRYGALRLVEETAQDLRLAAGPDRRHRGTGALRLMRPDPFHHIEARRDELQYAIIDPIDLATNLIEAFLGLRLFHEWGIFIRRPVSKSKGLG